MRCLITGGSGFIGRALCRSLLADGHEAIVLTRDPQRARRRLPAQVALIERLRDAPNVDAVVNLAGENLAERRWTEARKQALRESRLATTRNLVDWIGACKHNPRVLVSGSAVGWYGARGDEELAEDAAAGNDFAAQLCRDWEAEAAKATAFGVRVCRVRTGIVLDADGGALEKMLLPFRLGLGGPFGDGRQWMSWIAREDEVRLIRWLIDTESAQGAYNATAPMPVTNADFTRALGAALHRPAILPAPAFALRLMLGEMADLLLTGQRVIPARAQAQGFKFLRGDLAAALNAILHTAA
ncbi:TIGR01777 family oxidoreductase [Rudaea sp.]|uniref:TIGR01777 family oxidoreductase n=1 Tax=Rudaea sp. TaxID=2136325 RepID=UPI00321F631E